MLFYVLFRVDIFSIIQQPEKDKLELARQRDTEKDKLKERTRQYYEMAAELEEERGKNKKLTAQLNKDFENSSIPSSKQKAGKKKIPDSREKTGRKPGGQPGHEGHARKQHAPDVTYGIPAPAEYIMPSSGLLLPKAKNSNYNFIFQ